MTDRIQNARDDLHDVETRLAELWTYMYDSDWEPESGRNTRGARSRTLWTPEQMSTVHRTYNAVQDELSRAHWALGRRTDVPVHWTRQPDPTYRAATVPYSYALAWCRVLDGMLVWLAEHPPVGDAEMALEEACGHVSAARGHIEDLWPPVRQPEVQLCSNGCGSVSRPRGAECDACAKYRQRTGKPRPVSTAV